MELELYSKQYITLRDSFVLFHNILCPHALAVAFGYNESHTQAFVSSGGDNDGHNAMTQRLLSQQYISAEDLAVLSSRLKMLLEQTHLANLAAEKQTVAIRVSNSGGNLYYAFDRW